MLAVAAATFGCGRSSFRGDKLAILPFENLSGDPAFDRFAAPAQAALGFATGSRIVVSTLPDAYLAGAATVAYGTITRPGNGRLKVAWDLFTAPGNKRISSSQAEGPESAGVFPLVELLARGVVPAAKSLSSIKPETLNLWAEVLNAPNANEVKPRCKQLLDADPSFSPGYMNCLAGLANTSGPAEVKDLIDRALPNRNTLDAGAQLALGDAAFRTGRLQAANQFLRGGVASDPNAWNQIGYCEVMLGNLPEAVKALEQYRRLSGQEANAIDSLGEIHFIAGKYTEAGKYFVEGAEKFPDFREGRDGLKAAAMRLLSGDRKGADEMVKKNFDAGKKAGSDSAGILQVWTLISAEQDPAKIRERVTQTLIALPQKSD